jgi:hypothetical protein
LEYGGGGAMADSVVQRVFDDEDLANLFLPNIMRPLYLNGNVLEACVQALQWCGLRKANGHTCTDPVAWEGLTSRIFGSNAPTLHNGGPRRNFYALCKRTADYRRGTLRLRNANTSPFPSDNAVRAFVLAGVRHRGSSLKHAAMALRNSEEVVLAAVRVDGRALVWATPALKDNAEIVLAAVLQTGLALEFASLDLQNRRAIVLAAVDKDPLALAFASATRRNDKDVVLLAVGLEGMALKFASAELKDDADVVLAAVMCWGQALQWASPRLQNDRGVVLAAVTDNDAAFHHASEELRRDPIVLDAVSYF